jgi:hypothetical protein
MIKNKYRIATSKKWLNFLIILSTENNRTRSLSHDETIKQFAHTKVRNFKVILIYALTIHDYVYFYYVCYIIWMCNM